MTCHGFNAHSAGTAPDLCTSPFILDRDAFRAAVKDGALVQAGMPAFTALDAKPIKLIRHHLRARSRQLAARPNRKN